MSRQTDLLAPQRSKGQELSRVGSLQSVLDDKHEQDGQPQPEDASGIAVTVKKVPEPDSPITKRARKLNKVESMRSLFELRNNADAEAAEEEQRPQGRHLIHRERVGSLRNVFEHAKERALSSPSRKSSSVRKTDATGGTAAAAMSKPPKSKSNGSTKESQLPDAGVIETSETTEFPNIDSPKEYPGEVESGPVKQPKKSEMEQSGRKGTMEQPESKTLQHEPPVVPARTGTEKESDMRSLFLMRADSINLSRTISKKGEHKEDGSESREKKENVTRPPLMKTDSINLSLSPKKKSDSDSARRSLFAKADSMVLSRSASKKSSTEDNGDETTTEPENAEHHDVAPPSRGFCRRDSLEHSSNKRKGPPRRRDSLDVGTIRSTHKDDESGNNQPKPETEVSGVNGRKVWFDESQNGSVDPFEQPPEPGAYFYSREEYQKFRDHTNTRVQKMSESNAEADAARRQVISGIYVSCCQVREEIDDVPINFLPLPAEHALKACYETSGSHIGLELMAVPVLRDDNEMRRKQSMEIVTGIQKELSFLPLHTKAEVLRQGLEPVTRPGALFARSVGKSLAAVVAESMAADAADGDKNSDHDKPPTKEQKEFLAPSASEKRTVSFSDNASLTVIDKAVNSDAPGECWYTREENYAFRASVAAEVEQLKRSESETDSRYKGIVSGLYLTCCRAEQEDADISFLPNRAKDSLKNCLSESEHRLGLEMMALHLLRDDNIHRRKDHLNRVLEMQKSLRTHPYHSDVQAEVIKRGVEPISLPSRLFALEMAFAIAPEGCPSLKSDTRQRMLRSDSKRQLLKPGSKKELLKIVSGRKLSRTDSKKKMSRSDSKKKMSKSDSSKKKTSESDNEQRETSERKKISKSDSKKKLSSGDSRKKPIDSDSKEDAGKADSKKKSSSSKSDSKKKSSKNKKSDVSSSNDVETQAVEASASIPVEA